MNTRPAPSSEPARALPAGRYGRTRGRTPRGWRRWVLTGLGLVAGCVVAYVAYRNLGSTPIDAERVGFQERPGNAMEITIDVTRDEPGRAGVCIVRVRDITGAESGRREVLVPPGAASTRVDSLIHGIGTPVTADVFGCSYDVPAYLSSEQRPTG